MKRTRFTESKIIAILKEAEAGAKVSDICRKYGISNATFYNWKSAYGELDAADLTRLRKVEEELNQLKHLYAELALENRALKELIGHKK